jgi:hypothetical protein
MADQIYIPPNDIIAMALTEAGENPEQNVSNPPYSFEVAIAKKHIDDVVQQALLDFNGIYGSMRATLEQLHFSPDKYKLYPEETAWIFPAHQDFDLRNMQIIQNIYYTSGQDHISIDWSTRLLTPVDPVLSPIEVIITTAPYLPQTIDCDFIYLNKMGDGSHIPSSGFDYKFARYASYLLAQKIANGLGNVRRGNDLMTLAGNFLGSVMSQFHRPHRPEITGGFLSSV